MNELQGRPEFAHRVNSVVSAGNDVTNIQCATYRIRKPLQRVQNVFRALVGKLLFEVVIVNPKGEALRGHPFVDVLEDVSCGIAGDIRYAKNSTEPDGGVQVAFFFYRWCIVRDAFDARLVDLAPKVLEPLQRRFGEIHELAA